MLYRQSNLITLCQNCVKFTTSGANNNVTGIAGSVVKWLSEESPCQKAVSVNHSNGHKMGNFSHLFRHSKIVLIFEKTENEAWYCPLKTKALLSRRR